MATAPLSPQIPQLAEVPRVTGAVHDKINKRPHKIAVFVFGVVFAVGVVYVLASLISDISHIHHPASFTFILLAVALLVALGFEFVNGFHDTANAVATVIYTHSLDPHVAVAWSGFWNFLGVALSTSGRM